MQDGPTPGARGSYVQNIEINRKKNQNLLQNLFAQVFKIKYVALSGGLLVALYEVCANEGPRIQDGSLPRGPRFKPYKYIEKYSKISFFRTTWLR